MKTFIRYNTFETNSSSTHSCIICSEDTFAKWKAGQLYVYRYGDSFFTREEIEEEYKRSHPDFDESDETMAEEMNEYIYDNYCTYSQWGDDYETDVNRAEVDGTKIVVACYYGYNG